MLEVVPPKMSVEMSGEQMQAKIAAARRDAEGLKDKIKRKKDELADTSCKCRFFELIRRSSRYALLVLPRVLVADHYFDHQCVG